jgi:hypothetical protein
MNLSARWHSVPFAPCLFIAGLLGGLTAPAAPAALEVSFRRGDANADGGLDISDAVFTLRFLFLGGDPGSCADAADANDDGAVDLSDPVHLLNYLFLGGPEPPPPGLTCGGDPTPDLLGCAEYPSCAPGSGADDLAGIRPAEDCDELLPLLKEKLTESMEEALAANLSRALETLRWGCFDDFFVGPVADGGAQPDAQASEYSETNNQVEGVDEPDLVKTDGAYLYLAAQGRFQVIDAWPAEEARRVASLELPGTPKRLFVLGNRAVVYAALEPIASPQDLPWGGPWGGGLATTGEECTYGYDCDFLGDGRKLAIHVLDLGDRAAPKLIRTIELSGSYLSGRRLGSVVHTAVVFPELSVPGVSFWPPEVAEEWRLCGWGGHELDEETIRASFERLRLSNLEAIEQASLLELLPAVRDTRYGSGEPLVFEGILADCRSFYLPRSGDGRTFLSLISFAIDALEDVTATTIIGRPGAVYASHEALYIASRHRRWELERWFFDGPGAAPEASTVHKFRLAYGATGSEYLGSGVVKGRVLNQFAMDEHDGYLRIATTTGRLPSPDVHSTVSVLLEREGRLEVVGVTDEIAHGEDIRSVRFDGDRGYIVTFKKTDPLFVLELAAPEAPAIRGELKIPGFSTYMHLLDHDHLLSIGYDADDQGSFAWFTGILLQIFGVSDPENPLLLHREVIGSRGSTSDAVTDHLAFNYFRARGLLAVPMVVCEGQEGGGRFGDRMTFSGLMVYEVDPAAGFQYRGGVPHEVESSRYNCSNWWTRPNSHVKRSVFLEDYVFSVALERVNVSHLADLEHPVASIGLRP